MNEILVSSLLCNILLSCFCLLIITWVVAGIQTLINDRKEEKRRAEHEKCEQEQAVRDLEFHDKRMKSLDR